MVLPVRQWLILALCLVGFIAPSCSSSPTTSIDMAEGNFEQIPDKTSEILSNFYYAQVGINNSGMSHKFIVDTGSQFTAIFDAKNKQSILGQPIGKLQLNTDISDFNRSVLLADAYGDVKISVQGIETEIIAVGLPNDIFPISNDENVTLNVDGILGLNVIGKGRFDLQQGHFYPASVTTRNLNQAGYKTLKVDFSTKLPTISVTYSLRDGKNTTGLFILDTGYVGGGMLFKNAAFCSKLKTKAIRAVGIGNRNSFKIVTVAKIKFVNKLKNIEFLCNPENPTHENIHGVIGTTIVDGADIILDFKNRRIFARP